MRLLDVNTLALHEFHGRDIPPYAILSHTWGEGEVSLQDLQAGRGPNNKAGYRKIVLACNQAKQHDLPWAWVDTCCIDKTSSAELSEAINSMYQWYKESDVCYAYLSDVGDEFPYVADLPRHGMKQVSRWFHRAWTLQELIAPRKLIFYNREWVEIGHRSWEKIATTVSEITRIPEEIIQGVETLYPYSVAAKMSWAAHRSSTRLEDRAYSLIGLFDINMPLLYGEGDKAFVRLQEEILKETDDHSLLCWTVPKDSPRAWTLESVFAKSPDDFADSGNIRGNLFDSGAPSAMTNRGLEVRLRLKPQSYGLSSHLYPGNPECYTCDAALNAAELKSGVAVNQLSIVLVRTPQISSRHSQSINRHARLATPVLGRTAMSDTYVEEMILAIQAYAKLIYIHKTLFNWERDRFGAGGIHLQNIPISKGLCPRGPHNSLLGYEVRKVFFSGLAREIDGIDSLGTKKPIGRNMMWSPIYGCIVFGDRFKEAPRLSQLVEAPRLSQLVEPPPFVVFSLEASDKRNPFYILIAWGEGFIHFSAGQGGFGPGPFRPDYIRMSHPVDPMEEELHLRTILLDPSYPGTHEGNYQNMYGEIARTSIVFGDDHFEFTLEREDPNTAAGEAAGNRMHFLVHGDYDYNHDYDYDEDEDEV
ncbi:HET-domain-containing protein [Hypoxylon cercidicola]|nr:HET-domain-containing protein [Hypoxylon cercidicola]